MKLKHFLAAVTATGLVMGPVSRAEADNLGAFAVGAVALCIASGTCTGGKRTRPAPANPGISSYTRQQNRETQAALNYFGYPAGVVDGVLGRNSRSAIRTYQADMNFPVSGYLDEYQRSFLVASHQRILNGIIAPHNTAFATQGPRGFLRALRQEQVTGIVPGQPPIVTTTPVPPVTQHATQPILPAPAPAPAVPQRVITPAAPVTEATVNPAQPADPAVPNFGVAAAPQVAGPSMNALCNEVNILALSGSGNTDPSNITDPDFAMNQQFCGARSDAMARSTDIVASLAGFTEAQIDSQCQDLAGQMTAQIGGIAAKPVEVVTQEAQAFSQAAGLTGPQLTTTGQVCLGVGYKLDDPAVVLAGATLLVGSGQAAYGEVMGHHLRRGFGVGGNTTLANDWYVAALNAVDAGAEPAFLPAQAAERAAMQRAVLQQYGITAGFGTGRVVPTFISAQ